MEKHPLIATNSNGRSDLSGRGLTRLGAGVGVGLSPLVQELSELEAQILAIKQQLQSAMRRKRELEQYQSENQQANQTAPSQPTAHPSNQFVQYTQSHQQTNQHANTLPDF